MPASNAPARAVGGTGLRGGVEGALDHPVVLGNERHALALARHDERERGRLHAPRRAHVPVPRELDEREVARQRGAPDEIDVLTRRARRGEVVVHVDQIRERGRDLGLGERRVARPGDGGGFVDLAAAGQGIGPDKLALAVEVGGDDDRIRFLRKVLQRPDDVFFLGQLFDGRVNQIRQRLHLPAP